MAVGIPAPTLFAAAAVVLLGGHVVRAARHSFFFSRGDVPERFDLLLGLTLGQALNSLLPLRIGELVRSLFIAIRLRLRVSYVLATVAAERLADVIAVAVISAGLAEGAVGRRHLLLQTALWLALVAWVGVTVALLVQYVPRARRLVWQVASVFNDELRLAIVDFFSTLAHLVTDGPYLTVRFLVATLCMWGLYLGAYALYAVSVGSTLTDVSYALLGAPLRPLLDEALHGAVSRASLSLFVFTAIPVGVVLIYGIARQHREISRSIRFVGRFGLTPVQVSRPPVRSRFRNATDYAAFLQAHFSATDELVSTFVTEGTEDVVVHRLLPGGSDAVTAVVEANGTMTIRKLAAGGAGRKLGVQVAWLRQHAEALPLPAVVAERQYPDRLYYDMPYAITARDFYDVIHTAPPAASWRVLREVVECMGAFHRTHARGEATPATVDAYLEQKVRANAREVLTFARVALGDAFTINGERYELREWDCLLDLDWLRAQVRRRETAVIHGDLTIENVIVCPEYAGGWYLIDPNPDNVFDTPLIDWAKLMQSLNLGYEALNRGVGVASAHDGMVHLAFTKSDAYARLEHALSELLGERIGRDGLREVAFHEIVNYLRLTPYKLRHAPQKGITFFACTAVLLRRYADAYGR